MLNSKKFWAIMIVLAIIFVVVAWIKFESTTDPGKELAENKQAILKNTAELQQTKAEVNATKAAVVNVSKVVKVGVQNQKVLAEGINAVGSKVEQISNDTGLLPKIKFDTQKILNQTDYANVIIGNETISLGD